LHRHKRLGVAAVSCILVVVVLCLLTVSAPAAPLPASGYATQEIRYHHAPHAEHLNARGALLPREDQRKDAWSIYEQEEWDYFLYLPLVFKRYDPLAPWTGDARFGFGVSENPVEQYNVSLLHADWYINFGFRADPPSLPGLEFVQTIRLCEPDLGLLFGGNCWAPRTCGTDYSPSQAAIVDYATAQPGTLWLIGNEPDAPGQDCITPGRYAEMYHELYYIIKGADSSAKVAIGGVVQGTPLRLEYLDMILDEYQAIYDGMIPVDVWNVHAFILREEKDSWGCQIPPGIEAEEGMPYTLSDHDNMTIFAEQIVRFRQWMRDRGERNKPLVVTEYGILLSRYHDYPPGFDEPRVEDFMLATFDYFLSATSTSYGYPGDGNRLVQAWCWFSLDDSHFEGYESYSHLFDSETKQITPLGIAYGNYSASLP